MNRTDKGLRYVTLERVSSSEQREEGFSLEVQHEAIIQYAERMGGEIRESFHFAESASKYEERKEFRMLFDYVKTHHGTLDAMLFYKYDRLTRNPDDWLELEKLESETGVELISVTEPIPNNARGRKMRRDIINEAIFYSDNLSELVTNGMRRRAVSHGRCPGRAPYGLLNYRKGKAGLVKHHPENGPKIQLIFALYAYRFHTIDSLRAALFQEAIFYTDSTPWFPRSTLAKILRDRCYLGEVQYRGEWYPGEHGPLVDRTTWDRVQVLLGERNYQSHTLLFGGEVIRCGHCGHIITGEVKSKLLKDGTERSYVYYRCSKYSSKGHPRHRLKQDVLETQVRNIFGFLRLEDGPMQRLFLRGLRAKFDSEQAVNKERLTSLKKKHTELAEEEVRLVRKTLKKDFVDSDAYKHVATDIRDQIAAVTEQIEACDRQRAEEADIAVAAFELSQALDRKWLTVDMRAKRKLLEIICLNWTLNDVTLVPTYRKPFDAIAEGPSLVNGRGDKSTFKPLAARYAELLDRPTEPQVLAAKYFLESVEFSAC